jgi:hypothetical protein
MIVDQQLEVLTVLSLVLERIREQLNLYFDLLRCVYFSSFPRSYAWAVQPERPHTQVGRSVPA